MKKMTREEALAAFTAAQRSQIKPIEAIGAILIGVVLAALLHMVLP